MHKAGALPNKTTRAAIKNIWFIKKLWNTIIYEYACPNPLNGAFEVSDSHSFVTFHFPVLNIRSWTLTNNSHPQKALLKGWYWGEKNHSSPASYKSVVASSRTYVSVWSDFSSTVSGIGNSHWAFITTTICWWLTEEAIKAALTSERSELSGYSDWCSRLHSWLA